MKAARKAAVFLLIGTFLFNVIQAVLMEKTSYPKYRAWKNAENVDVVVLGNSHADNGIRAGTLSDELSVSSGESLTVFNYAVYGMRMEQMYYFVKEIFKIHVPKLVILETYAFCPLADGDREILARRAFDVFPLSKNKVEAIDYCVFNEHASYYVPLMKYHTRWEELTAYDIQVLHDDRLWPFCGSNGVYDGTVLEDPGDGWFTQEVPPLDETREITPSEKECLEKLLLLLEKEQVQLLFVSVPFKAQMGISSIEQVKINNYLRKHYVNGSTVRMLDMNRRWEELDFGYGDLYNAGHVNTYGADKVTACLWTYLKKYITYFK